MQTAKRSEIIIPANRQRQEFGEEVMAGLTQSIASKGLLHAPVVCVGGNGELILVAGETRIKCLELIWMTGGQVRYDGQVLKEGEIPYTTLGQLSELEMEEAEWEENDKRAQLTWQENAAATTRLHRLRCKQAQAEGRTHTVADTAVEITGRSDGSFQNNIKKELAVAKHLDNPEVAKAKSTEEAFKILKRQEDQRKNVALAATVGATFKASIHEAHHSDCLQWLATCPPNTFDVIVTDPPYGMGADGFGDGDGRYANKEHHYKDDYETWKSLMSRWCPLSFRVTKPEAHAYVFCDFDKFHELKEMMQAAGWYVFRTPLIHTKLNGRLPLPDRGPRRQYEIALYAIKGNKKTNGVFSDVIQTLADVNNTHGAQKPVSLYENLLQRSARPGDVVLDSFAGGGTIFPAAHKYKCKAVGIEQAAEYYAICLKRLQELDRPDIPMNGTALGQELQSLLKA